MQAHPQAKALILTSCTYDGFRYDLAPIIEAAHARLDKANFALTSIRAGRRAGTKVFTVRDGTVGVPTLVISDAAA